MTMKKIIKKERSNKNENHSSMFDVTYKVTVRHGQKA